ncbi:cardiolipin synthase [Falsihalocynthiibacter sp. S25ZX9]|uniref:cardiolipin synthase n=1 Tax=Falsihalocynthiibacter sp. S25ZX9 TaxID=3240870 RepID=UPI00350FFC49
MALLLIALSGFLIVALCVVRILLRPNRDPAARAAWIATVLAIPFVGVAAYIMLGETSIGRKRLKRMKDVKATLESAPDPEGGGLAMSQPKIKDVHLPLFNVGTSISGFSPVGGNSARLMDNSNAAIDAMVADVDAAQDHVHLIFYIWVPDRNGTKMAEALKRAAARGVTCRAMVDDIGSRSMVKSDLWKEMAAAGVNTAVALKVGNPIARIFDGRIDLRNHRKILVIDNKITYCGSQNCADPEFVQKAKFAPWVDAVMRFEGPIVRQNQRVFVGDWMESNQEDITSVLSHPYPDYAEGFPAQVVTSGPTSRASAMPEMFVTLIYSATRELFITTPYYVPVDALQAAICAAGNRGVKTTIIFPARNDDFAVGASSRSYYADLLAAGVTIYEYEAGLLHTKSMTVDDEITFIGSANMDRRSFDLNYENNILLQDHGMTKAMRARQEDYLKECRLVTVEEVQNWKWWQRLWNNALSIVGPLL